MSSSLDDLTEIWKFEESSGTRAGEIASQTLTDNNTVVQGGGKVSSSGAWFTAANLESLSRTTNSTLECGDIDFTFAVWVYLTFKGQVGVNTVIYKECQSGQRDYWLYIQNAMPILAKENASGTFKAVSSGVRLDNFHWHLVVCWHDATADTLNIQVDNATPVSSAMAAAGQSVGAGVGNFLVGSSGVAGQYLDGVLDNLAFWKRILTADERTMLYNAGNGLDYPFTPTLLWGQVVPGYADYPRRFLVPRIST